MLNKKSIIISGFMLLFIYLLTGCSTFAYKKLSPDESIKILELAQSDEKKGQFKDSIKNYNKYIKNNFLTKRENAKFIYQIANIYFSKLNDSKNALKFTSILLKHYPFNSYTEKGYILESRIYLKQRNYYKIIRLLGRYLNKVKVPRTQENEMYFFVGKAYFELHQYKLSATYLNLISLDFNNKDILYDTFYLLAQIYWYQHNDRVMAYKYLQNLFKLDYKKGNFAEINLLFKKVRWQYISKEDGLNDTCVSAIAFDGDYIWMGLWLGGVARFTRSSHDLTIYGVRNGLISKYIRDIKIDHNNVWVATFEGISRYNKQYGTWYAYKSIPDVSYQKIKSIAIEKNYVWFGTLSRGIRRYNKSKDKWDSFSHKPKNILKIKKDPYSNLLVFGSLRKGFLIYDKKKWQQFTPKNSILGSKAVKDMAFDKNYVYVAAYKAGVYAYNKKTKKLKKLNLHKKSVYINSLKVWKNKLLVGTLGDGVIVYDLATKQVTNLSIKDGLTSDSIMTIETENDYIWFGTVNDGVNILYWPDSP